MNKILSAFEGFTFGCDPEVFIVDSEGKGVPARLAGIPGSKEQPEKIGDIWVQVDGFAAEFNIPPVSTYKDWNDYIAQALQRIKDLLPPGHSIAIVPSMEFSPEAFDLAPDSDKELGCQPDFNGWTGEVNEPPTCDEHPLMRCAGGHLHFGWGKDIDISDAKHMTTCMDFTQQCDWYLGAWANRYDKDKLRKNLYGKAGAFRPKSYGMEYRTLSNFWLTSRARQLEVWNRMQRACSDMRDAFLPEMYKSHNSTIIDYINSSKRDRQLENTFTFPLVSIGTEY